MTLGERQTLIDQARQALATAVADARSGNAATWEEVQAHALVSIAASLHLLTDK